MSLIPFLFPVQATAVLDEARRKLRLSDKEFGHALGYEHAYEWSKAKHGKRSCDLHEICAHASDAAQEAIAETWLEALRQRPERDLVADLIGRVERLLDVMGKPEPIKAELKDERDERRSA